MERIKITTPELQKLSKLFDQIQKKLENFTVTDNVWTSHKSGVQKLINTTVLYRDSQYIYCDGVPVYDLIENRYAKFDKI